MLSSPAQPLDRPRSLLLTDRQQAVLGLLHDAYECAQHPQRPLWDFAVRISTLRAAGLTDALLLWLMYQGYVEHAIEVTPQGETRRSFRPSEPLMFTGRTCLVLTEEGVRHLHTLFPQLAGARPEDAPGVGEQRPGPQPYWDSDRRELRLGPVLVKQFLRPAPNQELILAVLQEEGWPPRIDDPLPSRHDLDARERLHDTIKNLNRHQEQRLLRFQGDGTGRGVRWKVLGT